MTIPSIILLASLVGIIVMVGRKLALVKKGRISVEPLYGNPFLPEIEKLKASAKKNVRKYGYFALFATLRFYIHSASFLKKKSLELARNIEEKLQKSKLGTVLENAEKHEVNRYLKMISEYKLKISRMSRRIREEDGIE